MSEDDAPVGGMTLDEIGQVLGCTREYVRQIERRALWKMRRRLEMIEANPGRIDEFLRVWGERAA